MASSSNSIVERQFNYAGLIVRTFHHSSKPSSPPPTHGAAEEPPLDPAVQSSPVTAPSSSPVKRGRGRPRKNPKPPSIADDDNAADVSDQSSHPTTAAQEQPPKKKRRQASGVMERNNKLPDYMSLLTEEEMAAVRKRNRRGKQWVPGEKTIRNELERLGRSVNGEMGDENYGEQHNGDDGLEEEEPGSEPELEMAGGVDSGYHVDDVIDCDPFSGLEGMPFDVTDTTREAAGSDSGPVSGWVRVTNEQTHFQEQTEGQEQGSFDYYMFPPTGATALDPPSEALDKDSSFAEQLSSTAPDLSAPLALQQPDSMTTLSHPTPPPSSLSPQNPPPKAPAAPPPPATHVDSPAALKAHLAERITASQNSFIPSPVHCLFTLPLPTAEFTQKQYATDLVAAVSEVDRYVYVIKTSTWNSANGTRGAIFVCNMSLESLKKRKSAGTGEDQKKGNALSYRHLVYHKFQKLTALTRCSFHGED